MMREVNNSVFKKFRGSLIVCIALLSLFFSGCYYDKANLLYPVTACDTTKTISYTNDIVPLFESQSCYSCHKGSSPSGGISMGSYSADKVLADNGKLLGSISQAPGYKPMPKDLAKMPDCKISTVKKWIDSGSPNN